TAFGIEENKLRASQFDRSGNFAFGISEHTDFPGMKYDPTIGIYGMDVTVTLERPGYRVSKRKIGQRDMSKKHRLTRDDAVSFVKQTFGVEVV
ncbi:MAG TPA: 50S ribosomal protein L5, partial [Candidatus Methanoperedenaceae archaeon]|nr:50S ribosomal protein L5 [Candidatus Methanoperedenaceae archaeon]